MTTTALDMLKKEFPSLNDWPEGDLRDMLWSTSPRMSLENGKIQARYHELRKVHGDTHD